MAERVHSEKRISIRNILYDDFSSDMKHDLLLAFNIFKNEHNKINKLKLRTLLFSFIMYKSSAKDINEFISEHTNPKQDEFTYDDLCRLVFMKFKITKEKESDELFFSINGFKQDCGVNNKEISHAFEQNGMDVSLKEVNEMIKFMVGEKDNDKPHDDLFVTREEFKKFYTDK